MPKFLAITHESNGKVHHDLVLSHNAEAADDLISALHPRNSVRSIYSIEDLRNMLARLENATPQSMINRIQTAPAPYRRGGDEPPVSPKPMPQLLSAPAKKTLKAAPFSTQRPLKPSYSPSSKPIR